MGFSDDELIVKFRPTVGGKRRVCTYIRMLPEGVFPSTQRHKPYKHAINNRFAGYKVPYRQQAHKTDIRSVRPGSTCFTRCPKSDDSQANHVTFHSIIVLNHVYGTSFKYQQTIEHDSHIWLWYIIVD